MPTEPTPILGLPMPTLSDPWGLGGQRMRALALALDASFPTSPASDAGFPLAVNNITAETVIDRYTIPAAAFARRAQLVGHTYCTVSAANTQVNLVLYAGATAIGYARNNVPDTAPRTFLVTGKTDIPANTAVTLELRVGRQSGTGTVSTSISAALSNCNITLIRKV